ncbi:MAG: NUDIX hydrolase [Puniceicoccales bacterium]|jgi:8-oxo-dGTP pyrophosphatase MutT (NUDIX family)|nr:NUDIX hydrolase [Puniceicoccales bacterium]
MSKPSEWISLAEEILVACPIFKVINRRQQRLRDKREGDFFVIEAGDWVQALALTEDGRLLLVRQFRMGDSALSWEPPGGMAEPGEDPVTAAQRELAEETGYVGTNARLIGSCSPNPAIFNNRTHFVLVENCRHVRPLDLDDDEDVEAALFSPAEVETMLRTGEIRHALAQAAFLHLHFALPNIFASKP